VAPKAKEIDRADTSDSVSASSGAALRKFDTHTNKAWALQYVAKPFEIASDGYAYFLNDPAEALDVFVWLKKKVLDQVVSILFVGRRR